MNELTLEESKNISIGDFIYYDDGFYLGYNEVVAIDEVYNLNEEEVKKLGLRGSTVWFYPETGEVVGYADHSDNEWGFIKLDKEVLKSAEIVNRFFWIKEYDGGHSLPYYEVHTDSNFFEKEFDRV